jgi:acetyl esterase/lipase
MSYMKKIIGIVLVIIVLGVVSNAIAHKAKKSPEQKQEAQQAEQNTSHAPQKSEFDDTYGSNARNTIHVLLPKEVSSTTPMVLLIHGGEWKMGDKKDMLPVQQELVKEGIATASLNYRYASDSVHYKDLMKDVDDAVTYLNSHTKEWGMSNDHLSLIGISAGAHLALLYSYAYDKRNHVKAVISLAGPTDFTDTAWLDQTAKINKLSSVEDLLGSTYEKGKPLSFSFSDASPIKHIKNVPTLMVHGTADTIVLYKQSMELNAALEKAGVPHKLITLDNANHDLGLANPATALRIKTEAVNWIRQYAK